MGIYDTLKVEGKEYLKHFNAIKDGTPSKHTRYVYSELLTLRYFCGECGTALYAHHPSYAENVYPMASAIDTPLPKPPSFHHFWLSSKPDWVPVPEGANDRKFDEYPDIGIMDWHKKHNLLTE